MKELFTLQDKNTMYKHVFMGKLKRITEVINELGVHCSLVHPDANHSNYPEQFHFSADAIFKVSEFNEFVFRAALHDDKYHVVARHTSFKEDGPNEYFFAINFVY